MDNLENYISLLDATLAEADMMLKNDLKGEVVSYVQRLNKSLLSNYYAVVETLLHYFDSKLDEHRKRQKFNDIYQEKNEKFEIFVRRLCISAFDLFGRNNAACVEEAVRGRILLKAHCVVQNFILEEERKHNDHYTVAELMSRVCNFEAYTQSKQQIFTNTEDAGCHRKGQGGHRYGREDDMGQCSDFRTFYDLDVKQEDSQETLVDTGAMSSIISEKMFKQILKKKSAKGISTHGVNITSDLSGYGNQEIRCTEAIRLPIQVGHKQDFQFALVVRNSRSMRLILGWYTLAQMFGNFLPMELNQAIGIEGLKPYVPAKPTSLAETHRRSEAQNLGGGGAEIANLPNPLPAQSSKETAVVQMLLANKVGQSLDSQFNEVSSPSVLNIDYLKHCTLAVNEATVTEVMVSMAAKEGAREVLEPSCDKILEDIAVLHASGMKYLSIDYTHDPVTSQVVTSVVCRISSTPEQLYPGPLLMHTSNSSGLKVSSYEEEEMSLLDQRRQELDREEIFQLDQRRQVLDREQNVPVCCKRSVEELILLNSNSMKYSPVGYKNDPDTRQEIRPVAVRVPSVVEVLVPGSPSASTGITEPVIRDKETRLLLNSEKRSFDMDYPNRKAKSQQIPEGTEPTQVVKPKREPVMLHLKKVSQHQKSVKKVLQHQKHVQKVLQHQKHVQEVSQHPKSVKKVLQHHKHVQEVSQYQKTVEEVSQYPKTVEEVSQHPKTVTKVLQHHKHVQEVSQHPKTVKKVLQHHKHVQEVLQHPKSVGEVLQHPKSVGEVLQHPKTVPDTPVVLSAMASRRPAHTVPAQPESTEPSNSFFPSNITASRHPAHTVPAQPESTEPIHSLSLSSIMASRHPAHTVPAQPESLTEPNPLVASEEDDSTDPGRTVTYTLVRCDELKDEDDHSDGSLHFDFTEYDTSALQLSPLECMRVADAMLKNPVHSFIVICYPSSLPIQFKSNSGICSHLIYEIVQENVPAYNTASLKSIEVQRPSPGSKVSVRKVGANEDVMSVSSEKVTPSVALSKEISQLVKKSEKTKDKI